MTKILLVEDDNSLREIYSVRLSAEGYQVISVGNGEDALAAAVGEKPDLIVSDVMMPKISGFEMLDLLKSNDVTKNIPVIMLTALSSETQRDRGGNLGADRYLVKSQVGLEDIVRTVHEVLAQYGIEKPDSASSGDVTSSLARGASGTLGGDSSTFDSTSPLGISGVGGPSETQESTVSEPIINNPSILGTNFASAATADPNQASQDSADNNASAVPTEPAANQSSFNPDVATHPAEVSGANEPQMPDTPMRIPMPVGDSQQIVESQGQGSTNQTINYNNVVDSGRDAQLQPQILTQGVQEQSIPQEEPVIQNGVSMPEQGTQSEAIAQETTTIPGVSQEQESVSAESSSVTQEQAMTQGAYREDSQAQGLDGAESDTSSQELKAMQGLSQPQGQEATRNDAPAQEEAEMQGTPQAWGQQVSSSDQIATQGGDLVSASLQPQCNIAEPVAPTGGERTIQPIERKTPRIDIDSLLSGAA